jgi:hypothetical protein
VQDKHTLTDLAQEITQQAAAKGAQRVVFRTRERFIFSSPKNSSIVEALRNVGLVKYKLQNREGEHWKDIQRYRRLPAYEDDARGRRIINSIATANFDPLATTKPGTTAEAIRSEPERYEAALRALHRTIFLEFTQHRQSATLVRALDFLETLGQRVTDPSTDFFKTTLDLFKIIKPEALTQIYKAPAQTKLYEQISSRVKDRYRDASEASQAAASSTLGKVASLFDREIAARHFRDMTAMVSESLLENFYLEEGTHTYFTSAEISSGAEYRARELRQSIKPISVSAPKNRLGILMGMDPNFYRIYGPQLFFYAQHLPDVDFNILLCATAPEAQNLVEDGLAFQRGLETLNRIGVPENVHHFHVPIPEYVKNHETFFASARFFANELMLDRYRNVYLMDADLSTDVDPRPFLRELSSVPFAAPRMTGISAVYPWRRHMAGNVALSRAASGSNLLSDLQNYLVHGLHVEKSWTLDQNALTYAIERNPKTFTDMNFRQRPFYQSKFRLVWEKRHKESIS